MLSAAELRKLQSESAAARTEQQAELKTKREAELKARFIEACNEYREVILAEVKAALDFVREQRPSYKFIMLNHASLIKDVKGFSYTTLLYGFWNKEKGVFDDSIFKQYESTKPFELAAQELEALGYKLENVSDHTRSKRLYVKLSWTE
jgi:hypothetical protein